MDDSDELIATGFSGRTVDYMEAEELEEVEEIERNRVFSQLKPYCLELLQLLQNPRKDSYAVSSLLHFIRASPSSSLQPFFDYVLFPLLLLYDAAVDSRASKKKDDLSERDFTRNEPTWPHKVSDRVAEGVVECLEELLKKCHFGSVDQMVVVMKKLSYGAMLSPDEASEEFREGVVKCFKALLLNLSPCNDETCSCRQIIGVPALSDGRDMLPPVAKTLMNKLERRECLVRFLQSKFASAAVGHWLSLLLKIAGIEASRGHRGSAKLRVEAFVTLRVLVAKVGVADALAFFLPGVVSQFAKVLLVTRTMISGAAGSAEALNHAIRGLAEYLMIVLGDNVNMSSADMSLDVSAGFNLNKDKSVQSFLDELRQLPIKFQPQDNMIAEESVGETVNAMTPASKFKMDGSTKLPKEMVSFHVDRSRDWIHNTTANVAKLLGQTFPQICNHLAKKVRQALLAAIQGLLSECTYTLKDIRMMLLECVFVLIVDESEEVSFPAKEFLEHLLFSNGKYFAQHDVAEVFSRLIEKLPKVVLGYDKSLVLTHAQQLLVVVYYSGPQFMLDYFQSPVAAARFLDVFALCLSENSIYTGALDKLLSSRSSSVGYLQSVTELKAISVYDDQTIRDAVPHEISKFRDIRGGRIQQELETVGNGYEFPRMPPWFVHIGSDRLYHFLAGTLRLVGLSSLADLKTGAHLSAVTDIPLSHLYKLVSEVRTKDFNKESWLSWYNRTQSGKLVRQASTAVCILNEMMFGLSEQSLNKITRMFQTSRNIGEEEDSCARATNGQSFIGLVRMVWKVSEDKDGRSHLIECIGKILHEYLSLEIWDLPVDQASSGAHVEDEIEEITPHFFQDVSMLHQVIIDGIGISAISLGKHFAASGFLHLCLYPLLENLIHPIFQVRSAADSVLHAISATLGYPTVGQLVLANADYVIDSICRQLRQLDLNRRVPNVLASLLSYIGVAHKILPLLEEMMLSAAKELEILGRHQHPELIIPFLKAVAEIAKASKHEASSLPLDSESFLLHVKSKLRSMENEERVESSRCSSSHNNNDFDMDEVESEQWESIVLKLNDSRRYRRTVGSIAGSCLIAATPLLASMKQAECLVALDVVEAGAAALAKVEEAYCYEKETKEVIEDFFQSHAFYELHDTLGATEDGADENRLLPAVNKIWPFLVACVKNKNPTAVRRCSSVIASVVQISGGNFFTRRFHTDGQHFWKLLSTSPFQRKLFSKQEKLPLQLPYRSNLSSMEDSMAEGTHIKVQVAVLNMIAELSRNKRSASALHLVLKKVSGLVVGIVCSGIVGLRDASIDALAALASVDPDVIWLLLADVYYSMKKKGLPAPPSSEFPEFSQTLPPPLSPKAYLYLQYGGQNIGFDIDFSSVETAFRKLHTLVFTDQLYM